MIKNEIKMTLENSDIFDKKQVALAIRNSTLDDEFNCSILEEGILMNCNNCGLKDICKGIDDVAEEYVKSTSKCIKEFTFE